MLHTNHAVHGAILGFGLFYTGITSARNAMIVGGVATVYMMQYGHSLPF